MALKKVTGTVTYDVRVKCPHCDKRLQLNQYPYTDRGEDELGKELFGSITVPARWHGFEIEYTCCGCKKEFIIGSFEV